MIICNQILKKQKILSVKTVIVFTAHSLLERNNFLYSLENDKWMEWMQYQPEVDAAL